jgi:hypothetical protein
MWAFRQKPTLLENHGRNRGQINGKTTPDEVWKFLGVTAEQAIRIQEPFLRLIDIPQIPAALERVFPGSEKVRTMGWSDLLPNKWGPEQKLFQLADGSGTLGVSDGVQFYRTAEGLRFILVMREVHQELMCLEMIADGQYAERLKQNFQQLLLEINSVPHYLTGQVIDANAKPVKLPRQPLAFEEIALPQPTRELLLQNTRDLLLNRDRYRNWNMPLTRGIILHGPPGNGKTMIGRALASMRWGTFMFVRPEDLCEHGIKAMFKLARRLAPTIIFMEDLDFIANQRLRQAAAPHFAEFLVQLDSLERNDGLIIIATTNHLEKLDPAIKDRPNRFDVIIPIGLPEQPARRQILSQQLGQAATAGVIDSAAELTNGLSGAQVKEVAIRACQTAIQQNLQLGQLSPQHIELAIAGLGLSRKLPVGFATAH